MSPSCWHFVEKIPNLLWFIFWETLGYSSQMLHQAIWNVLIYIFLFIVDQVKARILAENQLRNFLPRVQKNWKPISFDRLKPKNVPAKRIFSIWLSGKFNKFRGLPLARLSLCWFNVRVLVNTQPTVPNLMQKFDNLGRHVYLISCHDVTALARGGGET